MREHHLFTLYYFFMRKKESLEISSDRNKQQYDIPMPFSDGEL